MAGRKGKGLKFKFTLFLFGLFTLVGGIILLITFLSTQSTMKRELINRGYSIGSTLGRSTGDLIQAEDKVLLKQNVNYVREFPSVSYVIIENDENEILADTFNNNIPDVIRNIKRSVSENVAVIQDTLISYTFA